MAADLKARFYATLSGNASKGYFQVRGSNKVPPAFLKKNRSDLLNHVHQYFAKFAQKQLKVPREAVQNLKLNEASVHFVWINPFFLEITGPRGEVDRVSKFITSRLDNPGKATNGNGVASSASSATSLVSVKSEPGKPSDLTKKPEQMMPKEETFLINDLQWYQTRFLFEKKYFQYVAEEFKELKVMLDKDLSKICFMGRKEEIGKAKDLALDILKSILGCEVDCEPSLLEKMIANESEYANLLRKENICCVIDKTSAKNKFTIYAASVEEIQKCKDILQLNASA